MYSAITIKAASMFLAAVIVADQRVMTDITQIVQGLISNVRSLAITVAYCAWPVLHAVLFPLIVACAHAFPRNRNLELISRLQIT